MRYVNLAYNLGLPLFALSVQRLGPTKPTVKVLLAEFGLREARYVSVFRRYQKTFIVVGGVILRFVFTIGDYLPNLIGAGGSGGGGRNPNDVAVKWDGGQLTERELASLINKRQLVNDFVRHISISGRRIAEEQGTADFSANVAPIALINPNWSQSQFEQMFSFGIFWPNKLANSG